MALSSILATRRFLDMTFLRSVCSHSEHATAATASTSSGIVLHLLADFQVDFEELGDAAVEADGFAFVQLAFAIVGWDAFLRAGADQTMRAFLLAVY